MLIIRGILLVTLVVQKKLLAIYCLSQGDEVCTKTIFTTDLQEPNLMTDSHQLESTRLRTKKFHNLS